MVLHLNPHMVAAEDITCASVVATFRLGLVG